MLRNRFAVSARRLDVPLTTFFYALGNSLLGLVQRACYGRRLATVELPADPLFILGHWRTGTTLLHELLILDSRHTFPSTFACLAPNHFLVTRRLFQRALWFMVPARRPMDNMPLSFEAPQEDEFALCNLGLPSPYTTAAFPNHGPQDGEYLDLAGLPPAALNRWKQTFLDFLRALALDDPRRIVLKSPTHTCRIKTLLELFPQARFVYLTRDPYVVFPSTRHLWRSLYDAQAMQIVDAPWIDDYVLETFVHMHDRYQSTRGLIPPGRLVEMRYEDLVADPLGQLRRIYDELALGGFDQVRPAIEQYLAARKDYQTNRYQLTSRERAEVTRRWGRVIAEQGYRVDRNGQAPPEAAE